MSLLAAPAGLRTLLVAERVRLAEAIVGLHLTAPDGALPGWAPGAHVTLHLPGGFVRPYSLCNRPGETGYRIAVLATPGGRGGAAAAQALRPGDRVQVAPPQNFFPLQNHAGRVVLAAGGIGITPLLPMAWALHQAGRDFTLLYSGRGQARMAFYEALRGAPFAVRLHDSTQGRLDAAGWAGLLAGAAALYACGPEGFLEAAAQAAGRAGLDALHTERFGALPAAPGGGFVVHLARAGRSVAVGPGQSIAQALAGAGIDIELSCEQGMCGTCITGLLDGEAEHRDAYLSAAERAAGRSILICCSRARGESLTLDL